VVRSDGRRFPSAPLAAAAIGVSGAAVTYAIRSGTTARKFQFRWHDAPQVEVQGNGRATVKANSVAAKRSGGMELSNARTKITAEIAALEAQIVEKRKLLDAIDVVEGHMTTERTKLSTKPCG
jgi:hypothetical protein